MLTVTPALCVLDTTRIVPVTASTRCCKVTAEAREDARQVNISARQTAECLRFTSLISPRCRSQTLTGGEQMGGILRQLSRDNGQLVHNNLACRKYKKDRCLPEKCRLYFRSRNCAVTITLNYHTEVLHHGSKLGERFQYFSVWNVRFHKLFSRSDGLISHVHLAVERRRPIF